MISKTDKTRPLAVFQGLKHGNRFWSMNTSATEPDRDMTKLDDGTVAYKILAYCDTGDECNAVIEADGYDSMEGHIKEHAEMYGKLGVDTDMLRDMSARERFERLGRISVVTLLQARQVHNQD